MKTTVKELREVIGQIISEAKKKKADKSKKPTKGVKPTGFSFDEAFDFSAPLGSLNTYAQQGSANWGPLTTSMFAGERRDESLAESAVRALVRQVIKEHDSKAIAAFGGSGTRGNIWEKAMHWYDNQKLGLGSQTSEGIEQKKLDNQKKAKKKGRK